MRKIKGRSGSRIGRLEMIRGLVESFKEQIKGKDATVSDFIRLIGLEREYRGEEEVREIRVTWVQSLEMEFER